MTALRYTREQICEGVREEVADCLAIDLEQVTPEANFRLDLQGESIDVLDLAFRVEKRFGIRSPFLRLTNPDHWSVDGTSRPTESMRAWLRSEFPTIDWDHYVASTSWSDPVNLFTIELMVDLLFDAQARGTPQGV